MSGFKPKFIVQFIIDVLVLGILLGIVSRVITAAAVNGLSLESTTVCYAITLIGGIFNALAIVIAVLLTQNTLAKKDVSDIDNPVMFYLIFSIIMIGLNIVFSIVGFSFTYNTCVENISTLAMQHDLMSTESLTSVENASERVQELIRSAVVKGVVIGNIVQALIIGVCIPLYKKRHETLF